MTDPEDDDLPMLRRAMAGDQGAWHAVLDRHRGALVRMVRFRLDQRLRGRFDASDVVQDALAEAAERLPRYLADPRVPPLLWLRFIARQKLIDLRRQHLDAARRNVDREAVGVLDAAADSSAVAAEFSGGLTGPVTAALRGEAQERVERALEAMSPSDREILVLRHFEDLGNTEAAMELGIEPAAASKRYVRALDRLAGALEGFLGKGRGEGP